MGLEPKSYSNLAIVLASNPPSQGTKFLLCKKTFSPNIFPRGIFPSLKSVPVLRESDWAQLLWMDRGCCCCIMIDDGYQGYQTKCGWLQSEPLLVEIANDFFLGLKLRRIKGWRGATRKVLTRKVLMRKVLKQKVLMRKVLHTTKSPTCKKS